MRLTTVTSGSRQLPGEDGLAQGRCLVTGVAGFIGSHLAEGLIEAGCEVVGVDSFVEYYPRPIKERNLLQLRQQSGFRFIEADLATADLGSLLDGTTHVFHQAGQAGVRASWDADFPSYVVNNIIVTQRLLQAVRRTPVEAFVFASSSSVYGNTPQLPTSEGALPMPVSPYGTTKLAAEHLCRLYAEGFGVPAVSLRYFTVYGPRQRPDMAFHKLCTALLDGSEFELYGDGDQTRDFTFVADIVRANLLAASSAAQNAGRVFNVGGGNRVTLNAVIRKLETMTGRRLKLKAAPRQAGDARHTFADCSAIESALGFTPDWKLEAGLDAQLTALRERVPA
jgi:UDP-glucose 4-epimerase